MFSRISVQCTVLVVIYLVRYSFILIVLAIKLKFKSLELKVTSL